MLHLYKFQTWKTSMEFRYRMESIFCFVITLIFQYYIWTFNTYLHLSREEAMEIIKAKDEGKSKHHIEKEMEKLHEDLTEASFEL